MKLLLALIVLFASFVANASTYEYGDFVTGTATAPAAGAVIADSGALLFIGPSFDVYDLSFAGSCSVTCTLQAGIYSATGAAVKVFTFVVNGGENFLFRIPHIPVSASQRFEVVNTALNLGMVSGEVSLALQQSY